MTDGGYAISPSWSPNGQFLTFSWNRKYGPGDPGGQDIYVMDIASKRWLQVTHESGSNDFPSWAPDGRHIVFERAIGGHTQIWSMLADGTEQHQLTQHGQQLHAQLELEVSRKLAQDRAVQIRTSSKKCRRRTRSAAEAPVRMNYNTNGC